MSPYKLKELRNTEHHEQAIMKHVKHNLDKKTRKKNVFTPILATIVTIATLLFIIAQLNNSTSNMQTASGYTILNVFQQVDGNGVAHSELFKEYDQQHLRQLTYFKPVSLATFTNANHVKLPNIIPPFEEAKAQVLAVNDGMQTELQFTFKTGNSDEQPEQFIVISAAKHFMNPLNNDSIENVEQDITGNVVVDELLNETTPLFHQILTTNGGLAYNYFTYDAEANKINVMKTLANELYTYYNGIIYHVGYNVDGDRDEVVSYVKEFILTSNLHELDLEQNTMGDRANAKGGRSRIIAASIVCIALVVAAFLSTGATIKFKQITWGIVTMFVIAPLLSWLIGISYGIYVGEGFAVVGVMIILFPILFIVGLALLLIGIFKKDEKHI